MEKDKEKNINEDNLEEKDKNEEGTSTGSDDKEEGNQSNKSGMKSDDSKTDEEDKSKEKTFTQEQVNAMMTKEKKQGRNSVYNELGINPKDEKQLAMIKAFVDSQKTEEDKKAEAEQTAFEQEKALAIANAKVEIMKQGVKSQYVDDAVSLVMSQLNEDNDVASVLGSFKAKYPIWFEPEKNDDDKQSVGKKGTGSSIKGDKKGSSSKEDRSLGSRLAAQRKGNSKKSSYWK